MQPIKPTKPAERAAARLLAAALLLLGLLGCARDAGAHPLGNFTVNHYARIRVADGEVRLRYVVDMAEIPTFQELQKMGAAGGRMPSAAALAAYASPAVAQYARNIVLSEDGARVALTPVRARAFTKPGAGGLPILDVACDLMGALPVGAVGSTHRLHFEDDNAPDRIGWREVVVGPAPGVSVFNSSAYGNAVTDELRTYPRNMIAAPLDERAADLSWTVGPAPAGTSALRVRGGRPLVTPARDRFAELIAVKTVTPGIALLGLLLAFLWGAGHAFSPGHGKTVVGAYLVGSRGTARHAVFLGTTVTITHTLGVFALGLLTLFASKYIVPEQLFPVLTLISGGAVLLLGLSLFTQRLTAGFGIIAHDHPHDHDHAGIHSHGGHPHSHLPPGADGRPLTWRSLLALGISGGLLPCPSALLVLLSAVALHRVAYGLILVIAFSLGLAATLTAIGLAFIHAGRWMMRSRPGLACSPVLRVLPALSALLVAGAGALICYSAFGPAGVALLARAGGAVGQPLVTPGVLALLVVGLALGVRQAAEVDHAAGGGYIRGRLTLISALQVGGQIASVLVVGVIVLALRVLIPESVSGGLKSAAALTLIVLGGMALTRLARRNAHGHAHDHGHENGTASLVGTGAAALLALLLTASAQAGLLYLAVFGVGSLAGALLPGLPPTLSSHGLNGVAARLRAAGGVVGTRPR